jgi:HlyD family secretion protein
MMRRLLTILGVLALLIAGSLLLYRFTSQAKEPPAPDFETLDVTRGDLISTVSATGAIEPAGEIALFFRGAGRVGEVLVAQGDAVTAGQVLARLETDDLDLSLAQAETALVISQAQLEKLQTAADETDLAAAEAAVASAQASAESAQAALASAQAAYSNLQAGATEDQKQAAAATLERARVVRDQAQAAYDQIAGQPNVGMMPQALQLQQATIDYETAAANYRISTAPATAAQLASARAQIAQAEASLAQAEASLAQAEANLAKLRRGPSPAELTIAEAQVTQGELSVQQAQLQRRNSELVSPSDGTVTALNIAAGELPSAAKAAAVITDLSRFHINITVDEIDIGKLSEGQKVRVTLDAAPDAELLGHISAIAATPISTGGTVSYDVTVAIDETDAALRSGLSATASIVTQELADVVLIPNRSIQIDRSTGRAYVEKLVAGAPTRTEVQLGERNEQYSQVLSGLSVGDVLAIRSGSGLDRLRSTMFGG